MNNSSFPRFKKVAKALKPGSVYNGVTLLPGWLNTESPTTGTNKEKLYTWSLRGKEGRARPPNNCKSFDRVSFKENRICDLE